MPEYRFTPEAGKAKVLKALNIRKGVPTTSVPKVREVAAGTELSYLGWVSDGEAILGNAKWFLDNEGNFFWSGNTGTAGAVPPDYKPVTVPQLSVILPSLAPIKLTEYAPLLNDAMKEYGVTTPLRQAAFIAQTAHESIGYIAFVENLNYSADALIRTWPSRFNMGNAALYARQPQKIGNRAYANRVGNGDEASGDGWKYRGRGIIQITFKDNYRACGTGLGLDLVASPELLEQPRHAFRSGAWFWKSRNLNPLADTQDFIGITRIINGGVNGLDDRLKYYARAKTALGIA